MTGLLELGNYGANLLTGGVSQRGMRALSKAEMDAQMAMIAPSMRNVNLSLLDHQRMMNAARPTPKPTMTLAEWDERRGLMYQTHQAVGGVGI